MKLRSVLTLFFSLFFSLGFAQVTKTVPFYAGSGTDGLDQKGTPYSTVRSASIGRYRNTLLVYQYFEAGQNLHFIGRGFLSFDTSGIPDTANISNVVLQIAPLTISVFSHSTVDVCQSTQQSPSAVTASDFPRVGTTVAGSLDTQSFQRNQYATIPLNSTGRGWINKTGKTTLALRDRNDRQNVPYSGGSSQGYIMWLHGIDSTMPPYLEITYTTQPATTAPIITEPMAGSKVARGSTLTVRWDAVPGATQYQIDLNNNFVTPAERGPQITSNTQITWNVNSPTIIPNDVYTIRVIPLDGTTQGTAARCQFTLDSPPPVPSPQQPSNGGSLVPGRLLTFEFDNPTESWGADSDANYFQILVSHDVNFSNVIKSEAWGQASSTTISKEVDFSQTLDPGTYYWKVRAQKTWYPIWSAYSTPFSFIVQDVDPIDPPASAPVVTATPLNASVQLTWPGITGATAYRVYRSLQSDGPFVLIFTANTSFLNDNLTNGTTYFYKVSPINEGGEGPLSAVVSATPQGPPLPPTGLHIISGIVGGQLGITWRASETATSYKLFRSQTSSTGYIQIPGTISDTNFTDAGLTNGVSYYYVVKSVSPFGESLYSDEVSAIPVFPTPKKDEIADNAEQSHSATGVDPVNLATGNFHYTRTDLRVPSIGFPFEFTRTYNVMGRTDGPLGWGWRHSYQITAEEQPDNSVLLTWGDGHIEKYEPDGGGYRAEYNGYQGDFEKQPDNSFTFTTPHGMKYTFDSDGDLLEIKDRHGDANKLTLNYGPGNVSSKVLQSITDTTDRTYAFTHDPLTDKISSLTDPLGRAWNYIYDANGDLINVETPQRTGYPVEYYTFAYDLQHRLETITDRRNITFIYNTFDADDRVIEQIDAKGGLWKVAYNNAIRTTTVTDPANREEVISWDENWRVQSWTNAASEMSDTNWDANNRRTSVVDPKGYSTSNVHDDQGNRLATTNPLRQTFSTEYNTDNDPTQSTDNISRTTKFEHTVYGDLTAVEHVDNSRNEYAYTIRGLMTSSLNRAADGITISDQTTYGYDDHGNQTFVLNPDGTKRYAEFDDVSRMVKSGDGETTTTLTYDEANNVIGTLLEAPGGITLTTQAEFDANGNRTGSQNARGYWTYFELDNHDNLTTTTAPLNTITVNVFDELDRHVETIDARGFHWKTRYNEAGRVYQTEDPLGGIVENHYDANGNNDLTINENLHATSREYDELNRLTRTVDAEGNPFATLFDSAGRVQFIVDGLGNKTENKYDALDRLIEVIDAEQNAQKYEFDPDTGTLSAIIDGENNRWEFEYEPGTNRLTKKRDPENREWSFFYDSKGRLYQTQGPDLVTKTLSFDGLGRVIAIDYSDDTPDVTLITYDENSNRKSVTVAGLGTWNYDYDELDRLSSVTDIYGKTVGYEYEPTGQIKKIIYPDGKEVNYVWDEAGRLKEVTAWLGLVATITRDDVGQVKTITYGNNTVNRRYYDRAERLIEISNEYPDGTAFFHNRIVLDGNGNHLYHDRTDSVERALKREDISYDYDPAHRLNNVTDQYGPDESNTWEDAGNLASKNNDGDTTNFEYDAENRLEGISSSTYNATFTHDADDNRIKADRGVLGVTKYILDINGPLDNVLCEADASDAITAYYIHAPGIGLLARVETGTDAVTYYHGDHLGSVVGITDESAQLVQAYAYDEFGEIQGQLTSLEQPFTYIGLLGVQQETPRLLFMRARYYDVRTGRFLQKDPAEQFMSPYLYAAQNPILFNDPLGLSIASNAPFVYHYVKPCFLPGLLFGGIGYPSCVYIKNKFGKSEPLDLSETFVAKDYWSSPPIQKYRTQVISYVKEEWKNGKTSGTHPGRYNNLEPYIYSLGDGKDKANWVIEERSDGVYAIITFFRENDEFRDIYDIENFNKMFNTSIPIFEAGVAYKIKISYAEPVKIKNYR